MKRKIMSALAICALSMSGLVVASGPASAGTYNGPWGCDFLMWKSASSVSTYNYKCYMAQPRVGYYTASGKRLYRYGAMGKGTNSVGERRVFVKQGRGYHGVASGAWQ